MTKSALLNECKHHEIALLGVPEQYRVKLAFLVGYRFAIEPGCLNELRRNANAPSKSEHFYLSQACLKQISKAENDLFDEIKAVFGFPAASQFMSATKTLKTVRECLYEIDAIANDLMRKDGPKSTTGPATASPSEEARQSPAAAFAADPQQPQETAGATSMSPGPEDSPTLKKDPCNCFFCQLQREFENKIRGQVA